MRVALAVAAVLFVTSAPALAATTPAGLTAGKTLFKANCGKCHTFKAAGTVARNPDGNGPILTGIRLTVTKVLSQMAAGGNTMPSFMGTLTSKQMNQVAAFVAASSK